MTTFAARLNTLRSQTQKSDLALSKELGISNSLLRKYLRGANPGLDNILKIAAAKKVRVGWLANGEEPREISSDRDISRTITQSERLGGAEMLVNDNTIAGRNVVLLPYLSVRVSAGRGITSNSEEMEGLVALSIDYLRQIGVDPRHAHVLQVDGRSMVPTINDKDVVVIDTSKTTIVREGIYTLVYGDAVLIKRIRLLRDGSIRIVSDNKAEGYGDEDVSRAELNTLRIVGQVKGQVRAL